MWLILRGVVEYTTVTGGRKHSTQFFVSMLNHVSVIIIQIMAIIYRSRVTIL